MKITGFSSADVVVHTTLLGGGFGRRFEPDVLADAVETSKAAPGARQGDLDA